MDEDKLNIFLDLDNTLIYSIDIPKNGNIPKWTKKFNYRVMKSDDFLIIERPGLQKFLDWIFKNFNVSIWSAASPKYVEFIASNIVERDKRRVLNYVLNHDTCEISQKHYGYDSIKNLNLLWDVYDLKGYGPNSTIIIDDLAMVNKDNKHNSIKIAKFIAKDTTAHDNDLERVKKELIKIQSHYKSHINDPIFNLM